MWVHNDTLNKTGFHDVITVGAFSAHSQRADKPGGLIKLVQQSKDTSTHKAEMMANTNRLEAEFEKYRAMKSLRDIVSTQMDSVLVLLQGAKFEDTRKPVEAIRDNMRQIMELWDHVATEEALSRVGWNKQRIDEESEELKQERLARQAKAAAKSETAATPEDSATPESGAAPEGASIPQGAIAPQGAVAPQAVAQEAAIALEGAAAPEGAAGASEPESANTARGPYDRSDVALTMSAVNNYCVGVVSAATLRIIVAVAEAGGNLLPSYPHKVIGPASKTISIASSSSSSVDTTPTCDLASFSASVPDMQASAEIHFNSPRSDRSASGTSGQSVKIVKKPRGCKNNRLPKNERAGAKKGWNHSFRSARGERTEASAPPERTARVHIDFKSSVSLEQVSFTSLLNSGIDHDKKKAKKFRRDRSPNIIAPDPATRDYNLNFFTDLTEAVDDLLATIVANICDIIDRRIYNEHGFFEIRILMDLLVRLIDEVQKWTRMAHTAMRIDTETPAWAIEHSALRIRRDICLSQALTTCAAGLTCWAASAPRDVVAKIVMSGLGPLCDFEGLLSLYGGEKTMWGDMVVAIEDLHTVTFKFVKVTSSTPFIPQVTGSRNSLLVEIPVTDGLYSRFEEKQVKPIFTVTAVFFNIGINEKASISDAMGDTKPQHFSNSDNLERLNKYYHNYCKHFPQDPTEAVRASSRSKPLEEVMAILRSAVQRRAVRNVEVLQMASLATRQMHGVRFTSCKSAKDRTGMSVTLEQANVLSSEYHLADHERNKALAIMRSEGCRRANAEKNIGLSKYAFTKKQVLSLPEDYRPPNGSYGTNET